MLIAFCLVTAFIFGINFYKQSIQLTDKITTKVEPEWLKKTLRIVLYLVCFVIIGVGFICTSIVTIAVLSGQPEKKNNK